MVFRPFEYAAVPMTMPYDYQYGLEHQHQMVALDPMFSRKESSAPRATRRRIVRRSIHGSFGSERHQALPPISLPHRNNSPTDVWWDPNIENTVDKRVLFPSHLPDSPTTAQLYGFTDPWQNWRAEAERC